MRRLLGQVRLWKKLIITNASGNETFNVLLNSLTAPHLCTLARNFGLKNLGSRTKFEICLAMAEKKHHATRYNINALAKTASSINNTKNIICVTNGGFHPDNYDSFLCINNWKDRADFEYRNGRNNNVFWSIIADLVNNASNESLDTFLIIDNNDEYNKCIDKAVVSGQQLTGCSQQTGITCKTIIKSVVKVRGTIISNMAKSGQHNNDPYLYTDIAIKRHSLVQLLYVLH
jgi:hypothetical protein